MRNVTKKNLVEEIAERTGLTQVDTKIVVEHLLEAIANSLSDGRNIEIRGFGRFKIKKKKGRMARNPRTGEVVEVKEGFKPVFEASKELKKKLNEIDVSEFAARIKAFKEGDVPENKTEESLLVIEFDLLLRRVNIGIDTGRVNLKKTEP